MRTSLVLVIGLVVGCDDDGVRHLPDGPVTVDAAPDAVPDAGCDDCDNDGVIAALDCNDHDATIHPGAIDTCNTVDDDCSGSADELAATFEGVDISDQIAIGTMLAPFKYTPTSAGTLHFCGAGPYYVQVTATANLTVTGVARATTVVDGALLGTPFTVATAGVTMSISDLTVTRGFGSFDTCFGANQDAGGAIACSGATLNVSRVNVTASQAQWGGGIASCQCTTQLTDVLVSGNTASIAGGIAANSGTVTITTSEISNNTATAIGGALVVVNPGVQVALVDSLVKANAGGAMGAIYNEQSLTCTSSLAASTHGVIGNSGYGVYMVGSSANFSSTNCDFGDVVADDNTPADVRAANGALDFAKPNNATFACTHLTCN